jgi:plasmid stabilization system protein ParE
LKVVYTPTAIRELTEIYEWNERTYGARHAREYIQFLTDRIGLLSHDRGIGKPAESRPHLNVLKIRRKRKGYGHVAVYRVSDMEVTVMNIFHSSQDWETKLLDIE